MNPNFFSNIKIENFKSLQSIELQDCSRINLFIGKPNVGKSNILEALSLFSIPFETRLISYNLFNDLIRIGVDSELFYDGEESMELKIKSNLENLIVNFDEQNTLTLNGERLVDSFDRKENNVKKYIFRSIRDLELKNQGFKGKSLMFPFGDNLLNIIQSNAKLLSEVRDLFRAYRLQLIIDKTSNSLRIAKKQKNESEDLPVIFTMPYGSVADTLQRIIFYKAAIASNENSILLFEEPEAHAFPPYISHITQEMIDSKTNQFFVTTHSPFVLNDLLENAREELSVFIVDWKDGETTVKRLTDDELYEAYQYGIDFFTNIETFI